MAMDGVGDMMRRWWASIPPDERRWVFGPLAWSVFGLCWVIRLGTMPEDQTFGFTMFLVLTVAIWMQGGYV